MYTSYFGLKENPFSLTPDPGYLYLSRNHKEAFDHLLYGINERKGFIVVTGGIGTGKTTLCRALLGTLPSSTRTALILNAYISDIELLRTINEEFGIRSPVTPQSNKDYVDGLNQFLLDTFSAGENAVLLIDEAQNLSPAVLEQIRMLSNLETEKEKLLQIVLTGQSELRDLLASPALRQLDERIMVRYDLKSLDRKDVEGYIDHRLVIAGGRGNLRFSKGALDAIYKYSQGNPRRINGVCDRALLIAYTKDELAISAKTVIKAIDDVRGSFPIGRRRTIWTQSRIAWSTAFITLLLIAIVSVGDWGLRREISGVVSNEARRGPGEDGSPRTKIGAGAKSGPPIVKQRGAPPMAKDAQGLRLQETRIEIARSLLLDEQTSVAGLFGLFKRRSDGAVGRENVHLGLFSYRSEPDHYVMFKKPFRVLIEDSVSPSGYGGQQKNPTARYLLVSSVTTDGAIVIDSDGGEQPISRDFLLSHWGGEVSWIYPYKDYDMDLAKGMTGDAITKIQQGLADLGYQLEITGNYGNSTALQVMRFQHDFGLKADGIAGARTKGVLYQMTES